ncbi:response regulator [Pseudomonas oryzihabitans]|uniref:Response regulator n=2 Tax=Pseudomonas oryzihabitans TaxID=47885 RepID=A0A2Z5AAA4_9PSED|nr:response regulator [Pseudomonas oryzihabitans]
MTRVLVIDDEPVLRELMCELVEERGGKPIALASADAGMAYLENHVDEIGLLVTDVRMPGLLDGHALARLVLDRWPELPVVITSGYDGELLYRVPENAQFIAKPWDVAQFQAVIEPYLLD